MEKLKLERSKVVFINLTEMIHYNGLEKGLRGGGSFIEENGFGHEIFNFQDEDGVFYGYTPPWSKLNLRRISNNICSDNNGKYIDDVLVVFTCSRENSGRLICGFYNKARVYEKPLKDNRAKRVIKLGNHKIYAEYNIICNAENSILINTMQREYTLPHASNNIAVGHGHHAVWYTDLQERSEEVNKAIDYLEKYINHVIVNDEFKYHLHNENKSIETTIKQFYRSQKARNECIKAFGCKCKICGFDFKKTYSELGENYIEVHHITPIGKLSSAENYDGTNPLTDLIPLCSNCHSMIHRCKVPLQPKELKAILENQLKIANKE